MPGASPYSSSDFTGSTFAKKTLTVVKEQDGAIPGTAQSRHGVRAIEDAGLVSVLAERGIPLGICPTSNLALGVYPSIEEHPVDRLRRAGVRISLNTDDPSLLGASLEGEYALCSAAYGWSDEDVRAIARTSIDASFASEDVKRRLRDELRCW